MTGAVKTDTANSKENTVKEEIGMTLLICLVYSDTNDEEEEETPLTVRILFSLERCLLMGDTLAPSMDEYILRTFHFNKPKTLLIAEPLDSTLRHYNLPSKSDF